MTQSVSSLILNDWLIAILWPAVVIVLISFYVRKSWVLPSLIVVGIALIPAIRTQMWYEVYKSWSLGMICSMGYSLLFEIFRSKLRIWGLVATLVSILAILPLIIFSYRHGWLEGPRGYPRDLTWGWGMTTENDTVPYFTSEDEKHVMASLKKILLTGEGRIMFQPDAEALLFRQIHDHFKIIQPVRTGVVADWVIHRDSRYHPSWIREVFLSRITNEYKKIALLYERNCTERWTLWGNEKCAINIR